MSLDARPDAQAEAAGFDPFELPDTLQITDVPDPYPYLAEARRRGSVQREWPLPTDLVPVDAGEQFDEQAFSVLGRDEVLTVLRDDQTYSSAVLAEIMSPVLDGALIALDEPEHRARRALIAPAFRPKLLARWRDDLVARVVDELLDEIIEAGHADLVRRLTFAFPVRVIARILGLPERDSERFQRWSTELISILVRWDRGIAAHEALQAYFAECTAERRRHPGDDLISELIDTEVDGTRLTDADIFRFLELLLPAGIETTYRSFGNTLFALLTHPDQLEEVLGADEPRAAAIEEALRWETPLLVVPRRCTRDTTLAGVDIPAGADLNVFLGSANRDERHYTDPDRFDVHRPLAPIASFGSGPHACLGMHLARMEMRGALDAVLDRLTDLRLDPEAPRPRIVGGAFRSPDALPVTFAA